MCILCHNIGRTLFPLLLTTCICAIALGCAGARTPGDANGPEANGRQDSKTDVENGAQAPTTMQMPPEPPGSTLSYGRETVEAGLGAYCWTTARATSCVDAIGVSLGGGKLTVPSGAPLSFEYKGNKLNSLNVTAYEVGPESGGGNRIEKGVLVPPYARGGKEERPKVRRSGNRARIVARLPAGEYVFDVHARMPEGDVSYGFRLTVQARGAASEGVRAFANVRFDPAVPVGEVRRVAAEHGVEGGMIEGEYRIGGEVHTWGWTGGLGANFEKQHLGAFADMVDSAGQMSPEEREEFAPETPTTKRALKNNGAGAVKISGIEFRGPASVLEELVREEDARISKASVTTEAERRDVLRNLPKGCCN